jgi:hypothetical protein
MSNFTAALQSLIESNDPGDAFHKAIFHASAAKALTGHIEYARKKGEHEKADKLQRQQDLHDRAHHLASEKAKLYRVDEASKKRKRDKIDIHPRSNEDMNEQEDERLYRSSLRMMYYSARYGWNDAFKEHFHRALDHRVGQIVEAMRFIDAHERFSGDES